MIKRTSLETCYEYSVNNFEAFLRDIFYISLFLFEFLIEEMNKIDDLKFG